MFHGYGHGWGMIWGWIIGLIVLVALIWIIVKVASKNGRTPGDRDKTPVEILKERYARGEIEKKEYEERRKDLK